MNPNQQTGSEAPQWKKAPVILVLLCQASGMAVAFGIAYLILAGTGISVPLILILSGGGLTAAWLGNKFHLPRLWIPVQMALLPAAALVSLLAIPSWVYLAAFFIAAGVFWNSARTRVPLYLTNAKTLEAISQLIPMRAGIRILDLGHGIGNVVMYLGHKHPDVSVTGIESAPLLYVFSKLRALISGAPGIRILYGDFWKPDLAQYDVVYGFLSPAPMQAIYEKARREMKPGSLFISNSFVVPDVPPSQTVEVNDRRNTKLMIWKMP
ncbi:MAG: class I SAM-dependent methyltransferase [Rhodospirillales bacterium]|nr:class I SAM-dependent methyltransferase [Rhodospirillales bacterium]